MRSSPPPECRGITPVDHSISQVDFLSDPPFIDSSPLPHFNLPIGTDDIDFYDYNHINDAYLRTKRNSQLAYLPARFDIPLSFQFKEHSILRCPTPSPIVRQEEQIFCINPLLTIGTQNHHQHAFASL
jgi:hypothetical protein